MAPQFQKEDFSSYRARFLLQVIAPIVVFPPALALTILATARTITGNAVSSALRIFLVVSSIPVVGVIKVQYNKWSQRGMARANRAAEIPHVRGAWPGNLDILLRVAKQSKTHYLLDELKALFEECGSTTINLRLLWGDHIMTIDEGVVKHVLATGFENFDKGIFIKEIQEDFMGNGIFNRDGDIWKAHRAMARPFFARERISDFEHFEHYTAKTLDILEQADAGQAIDFQDLFGRFTLDTASAFLFNSEIHTLDLPLPKPNSTKLGSKGSAVEGEFGTFVTAFENSMHIIIKRLEASWLWPFLELHRNLAREPANVIKNWLDPIVRSAVERRGSKKDAEPDVDESSFLDYLASNIDDVSLIREQLLNILLAGRDTTSNLLTVVIYMLTENPHVMEKLRAETSAFCPRGELPTYDTLRQMKYLRAVLNEALRLFPAVPINVRASRDKPVLIPTSPTSDWGKRTDTRPLYMPANTNINYLPIHIHKREDLWGPDAHSFDPDRWLNDGTGRLERMVKNPLMFVPFNAGPRICLGQQFAYNEVSYFLVRLLQNYDSFELALDAQPEGSTPPLEWKNVKGSRAAVEKLWPHSAVTLFFTGGVWVRFHKAT